MFDVIGAVLCIEGEFRAVYLDHAGHEYFFNNDGQPIYGDWANLDGPEIVARDRPHFLMPYRANEEVSSFRGV